MNPVHLMTQACTITTVAMTGTPDVYGSPTEQTNTTATVCFLTQATRSEAGLEVVQAEKWTAFFPPDTVIAGADRITVGGDTFELDGPPWPAHNPRLGRVTHIEATLKRAR